MSLRAWLEARIRSLGIAVILLSGVGTLVSLFVVLVRVPRFATTRVEALSLTLQGVAVSLLFAIVGFLAALTLMIRRRDRHDNPAV